MNLAAIILAAGASTRMGSPKQLLRINGKSLIEVSIEHAEHVADKVYCVLGAHASLIEQEIKSYPVTIIENTEYTKGLSSSIEIGVESIENKHFTHFLLMLCDQPNIGSGHFQALKAKSLKHTDSIITSTYDNGFGIPAIFPKSYSQLLKELEGDKGAKELLNGGSLNLQSVGSKKLHDIDTPEDYQKFLEES